MIRVSWSAELAGEWNPFTYVVSQLEWLEQLGACGLGLSLPPCSLSSRIGEESKELKAEYQTCAQELQGIISITFYWPKSVSLDLNRGKNRFQNSMREWIGRCYYICSTNTI